jgi:hypothetical protein
MNKKQEKTGTNKVVRNEKGQIISGTPNPNGRPKGSGISITTEIKRKLKEVPKGQKASYLQLLIQRIFKKAIQDGDQQMITKIWNYVDGLPKQTISHGLDEKVEKIKIEIDRGETDRGTETESD